MTISVTSVQGVRDRRDFVALPRRLYARDGRWIAPPDASVRHLMSPAQNPFQREAFVEHFVARDRAGRCVGRVSATLHPEHMRRHGAKAFFGWLELENDENVARHLLAKVEEWADARGVRVVQGPCSYTMTQEAGLLLDGFDQPPVLLQPYNPPFYGELLNAAGYDPAFHMSTYRISRSSEHAEIAAAARRGEQARERLGLTARPFDMARFAEEIEHIRLCYNAAFAVHPETARISRPVFADQARELKAILDPRLVRIVEKAGRPLAFSVAVPNVYELLAATAGRLTLSLILRWKRLLTQVRSLVVIMIGGDPSLGGRAERAEISAGLGSCLAAEVALALNCGSYETVHTTWIHDANWRALALMRAIGAKPTKRYGIFQKELS